MATTPKRSTRFKDAALACVARRATAGGATDLECQSVSFLLDGPQPAILYAIMRKAPPRWLGKLVPPARPGAAVTANRKGQGSGLLWAIASCSAHAGWIDPTLRKFRRLYRS